MLPKKNRVDVKGVAQIFRKGRFLDSLNLNFKYLKSGSGEKRISVVVPKSVAKLATKRNSLRRLGYTAIEKYLGGFPSGIEGVLVFKKAQEDVSVIENEVKNILNKIN